MSPNKAALGELQMLTGFLSNDFDFLMYHLLKDGTYFESCKEEVKCSKLRTSGKTIDLEDWINSLEVL